VTTRYSIPSATYRLQMNREFTFAQATAIVPYLSELGISHCYVSPLLKARPGSLHGYDIVDHNSLNPEIGTPEEFDRFVDVLHQHNMGLIVDIVPNHMGVMGSDNLWWLDVLENGESSIYSCFFDIDWHPEKQELNGKVLIPVLHDHYGAVLESGEIKVVFYCERGEFDVCYRTHRFPIDPREYPRLLSRCEEHLTATMGATHPRLLDFQSLSTAFSHLPAKNEIEPARITERNRDKEILKRRLAELCGKDPEIKACIADSVNAMNGDPHNPGSFEELHELIKAQTFRLASWMVASDDINYRRFFDTNDLAGICVENETVYQATHGLILKLVAEGKVDGLRIDHPDGLYDPAQYFDRLKHSLKTAANGSPETRRYVVIEKILTGSEELPARWPVSGTTGYDFANLVNGLFVDQSAVTRLERIYRNFIGQEVDIEDLAYQSRKLIIRVALASELNVLATRLSRIALAKRRTCDFTLNSLRDALTEVASCFPVYRTYVTQSGASDNDARYIGIAIELAKWRSPAADTTIFDFLREVLLTHIAEGQDHAYRGIVTSMAMKFQQFTSPVMAKGLEDTAFYRYNRLTSLNEVGSDLRRFGTSVDEFHAANQQRQNEWPYTMLATSTHDSKRSEDVRARIDVLSEISAPWRLQLRKWKRFNRKFKRVVDAELAPSANDEYLLYQTLIGAWPSQPLTNNGNNSWENFRKRIEAYMLKAIREAKENTSWINQNKPYETAMSSFIKGLLTPNKSRFLEDFMPFQQNIARLGLWNSLAQTLLKLTCPGVPDIYQGNELFDFSLVDPDNRRPVDYQSRQESFNQIRHITSVKSLFESLDDGRLKQYLIWRTLCLRQDKPELFQRGEYWPLAIEGPKAHHAIAFARTSGPSTLLVIVPRMISNLLDGAKTPPIGEPVWADTRVMVPSKFAQGRWCNVLARNHLTFENEASLEQASVPLAEIFAEFPVALFVVG